MTVVSRVFLDHVEKDPSQRWLPAAGEQPLGRPVDSPSGKKLIHGMTELDTRFLPKGVLWFTALTEGRWGRRTTRPSEDCRRYRPRVGAIDR